MTLADTPQYRSYGGQIESGLAANLPTLGNPMPGTAQYYLATDTGVLYVFAYGDTAWRTVTENANTSNSQGVGGRKLFQATGVNLNATNGTDVAIFTLTLPGVCKRWALSQFWVSRPTNTTSTVSLGLYGQPAGAGTAIITGFTPLTTIQTDATTHNLDGVTGIAAATVAINTASYSLATYPKVYAHLITQEGTACTADLTLEVVPLP